MPNPASNPATTAPQPAVLARMFNGLTEGVAIVEGAFGKNGWVIAHSNPALSKLSGYAPAGLQKMTHGKLHKDRSDLAAMRRWAKQGADAASLAQRGLSQAQRRYDAVRRLDAQRIGRRRGQPHAGHDHLPGHDSQSAVAGSPGAFSATGGGRPTGRWCRPRFQQPPLGHQRLHGDFASPLGRRIERPQRDPRDPPGGPARSRL